MKAQAPVVEPYLPVSDNQFAKQMELIQSELKNPQQGIFGPDSWMWEITRHTLVFMGGIGRRFTLQVAHPWVTSAIDQHSIARSDSTGRARRTYTAVFAMIYGNLDQAMAAAKQTHRVHSKIEGSLQNSSGHFAVGTHYQASEAHAMFWIHATMWDTFARVYQLFVRPLNADELEAYYQETIRFAWFFGIPNDIIPPDWEAFQKYMNEMLEGDVLGVSQSTKELAEFVLTPPGLLTAPLMYWIRTLTFGLYPEKLLNAYGWKSNKLAFKVAVWIGKTGERLLPEKMRYLPSWHEAHARLQGKRADKFTQKMNFGLFRRTFLVS